MSAEKPVWKEEVVKLKFPINVEGNEVDKITLREPDVETLEAVEALGIEEGKEPTTAQLRGMIAAMARVDADVVKRLHRDDFAAVGSACIPLFLGEEVMEKLKAAPSPSPASSPGSAPEAEPTA